MKLTFKLPQQEQGVSIFEFSSSSWHIRHSTIFLGEEQSLESLSYEDKSISMSSAPTSVDCFDRFLLSNIAASKVDSVSNRSTSNTKWSPILKYQHPKSKFSLLKRKTMNPKPVTPWTSTYFLSFFFPPFGLWNKWFGISKTPEINQRKLDKSRYE